VQIPLSLFLFPQDCTPGRHPRGRFANPGDLCDPPRSRCRHDRERKKSRITPAAAAFRWSSFPTAWREGTQRSRIHVVQGAPHRIRSSPIWNETTNDTFWYQIPRYENAEKRFHAKIASAIFIRW